MKTYIYIYTHTIFPIPYANYQGPDIVEVVALASPPIFFSYLPQPPGTWGVLGVLEKGFRFIGWTPDKDT